MIVGLTSRIIPTYRRPLATRPVARDVIDNSQLLISYQCSQLLWQRPRDYFCFTIIANVIALREMPHPLYGSGSPKEFTTKTLMGVAKALDKKNLLLQAGNIKPRY